MTLKRGDRVPDDGNMILMKLTGMSKGLWNNYEYAVVGPGQDVFFGFESREEAILFMESAGKGFHEIPFEADVIALWYSRIVR